MILNLACGLHNEILLCSWTWKCIVVLGVPCSVGVGPGNVCVE